jgi:hypothetical protein
MDVRDTLTAPQLAEALQEPNTALLSRSCACWARAL